MLLTTAVGTPDRFVRPCNQENFDICGLSSNSFYEHLLRENIFRVPPGPSVFQSFHTTAVSEKKKNLVLEVPRLDFSSLAEKEKEKTAYRVLDAPGFVSDDSTSAVDWSARNAVAIAIGDGLVIKDLNTKEVAAIAQTSDGSNFEVVKFDLEGKRLAVLDHSGILQIFNLTTQDIPMHDLTPDMKNRVAETGLGVNGPGLASFKRACVSALFTRRSRASCGGGSESRHEGNRYCGRKRIWVAAKSRMEW